ncbi:hypothetical protein TURU_109566 [Turdus rufiventris]|nr:hypothetical protein TURU_109566 [Turdus rufiventris]
MRLILRAACIREIIVPDPHQRGSWVKGPKFLASIPPNSLTFVRFDKANPSPDGIALEIWSARKHLFNGYQEVMFQSNMWSNSTWFGMHVFIHVSLPFASPYINMGPITKATVAAIQFALWVDKMFGSTPPVFEGFKSPLNANDIIQWLVLLIGLSYLTFRDKGELSWITTLIPTPENRDGAADIDPVPETRDAVPEPDPAPQPTSERNHPEWVGILVKQMSKMSQMTEEYLSPAVDKYDKIPNGTKYTIQQLAGEGEFEKPSNLIHTLPEEVLQEIAIAAKTSFLLTPDDSKPTLHFSTIKQGVDESFIKFVDRHKDALEKQIDSSEAQKELLRKLPLCNANEQ